MAERQIGLRKRTAPQPEYAEYVPRRRHSMAELNLLQRGPRIDSPLAVVYYARRDDGSIKIGTSEHLSSRMRNLRSAHGPIILLATERGGYLIEARRHGQFASDALGHEWFRPSTVLIAHVETLAAGGSR